MRKMKLALGAALVAAATALPLSTAEAFWWPFGGWGGPWGGYPGYWGGNPGYWGGYPGHWNGYPGYWGGYPAYGYGYADPYRYTYSAPAQPPAQPQAPNTKTK